MTKTPTEVDPCVDCLGRDRFEGASPDEHEAPTAIREPVERTFRDFVRDHKRVFLLGFLAIAVLVFVFMVLPQIAGFGHTLTRLKQGDKRWLALAALFEAVSIGGYIAVFRTVFSTGDVKLSWSASYQITMASIVATKLFAAAGAGGVALTVWALRASGHSGRTVARRMTSFEVLLYVVFMTALVVFGFGLALGVLHGNRPTGLTIVPAVFGAGVILLVLAFLLLPDDISRFLRRHSDNSGRLHRLLLRLSTVPNTIRGGVSTAVEIVRRPRPELLGAVAYWAFDIATLWACFHAFGGKPHVGVIVMSYFVGQLANLIPLPGGIGGVEGGMIGCFIAFGVNGSTAVLAVLSYRALSFWLPTLPGALAYFQLRRTIGRWREPGTQAEPARA